MRNNLGHKVIGAANSWINSKAKCRSERFVTTLAKNLRKHERDDDKIDQHTMEDLESLALGTLYSEHLSEFSKVSAWVFDPGKSWDGLASFLKRWWSWLIWRWTILEKRGQILNHGKCTNLKELSHGQGHSREARDVIIEKGRFWSCFANSPIGDDQWA